MDEKQLLNHIKELPKEIESQVPYLRVKLRPFLRHDLPVNEAIKVDAGFIIRARKAGTDLFCDRAIDLTHLKMLVHSVGWEAWVNQICKWFDVEYEKVIYDKSIQLE